MISLIFIVLFLVIALKKGAFIKHHEMAIYLTLLVLAIVALIFNQHPLSTPIMQGYIGLAVFYLVMIASSLKPKTKIKKGLMGLRKHYSIIGFILITPHALYYLFKFLFNNGTFTPFGIASYTIMIPLFITSFYAIRKKMKPKVWKNLQRFAYVSYGLLLIHLILHFTQPINLVLYIVLAMVYFYLKIFAKINYGKASKKKMELNKQSS